MNLWFGKIFLLAGLIASIAIRVPHDKRSQETKVTESRKGRLEIFLLAVMMIGTMLLPVLFIFTPILSFADYELHPLAFALGAISMLTSLWFFHLSHRDLGKNWSMTLDIREGHSLVTEGVYRYIRHPMYSAIYLHALAQSLLLANWAAGPSMLIAFTLMFLVRVPFEERMMLEKFGAEYVSYMKRTKRLIPGVY